MTGHLGSGTAPADAQVTPAGTEPGGGRAAAAVVASSLAGGALLLASGAIHLDLYLTGYREIPTIGWLFLLQVIAAFGLGLACLVRVGPGPLKRAVAAAGGAFAASTLGGYLLSLWIGLFGFHEVRTEAGVVAAVLEVAAFGVLSVVVLSAFEGHLRRPVGLTLSVAAVVVLAAMLGGSEAAAGGGAAQTSHLHPRPGGHVAVFDVGIRDFRFHPSRFTVSPGELISVTNHDGVDHTFSSKPADRAHFSTGDIGPGQTRTVRAPLRPGTYPFQCDNHLFMVGTLVVRR